MQLHIEDVLPITTVRGGRPLDAPGLQFSLSKKKPWKVHRVPGLPFSLSKKKPWKVHCVSGYSFSLSKKKSDAPVEDSQRLHVLLKTLSYNDRIERGATGINAPAELIALYKP